MSKSEKIFEVSEIMEKWDSFSACVGHLIFEISQIPRKWLESSAKFQVSPGKFMEKIYGEVREFSAEISLYTLETLLKIN